MSTYLQALTRISDYSDSLVGDARKVLRDVMRDACEAISAAEGSILIPTASTEELRFLVSLNPALDESNYTFPCDGSVSGFVFNSSQAIAKIRPENEAVDQVGNIAKVETEFLLAIPIVDDERIHGVATFVNRTAEKSDEPFSAEDMRTAQSFGEIYATGLKFFRQLEVCAQLTRQDVGENAAELGMAGSFDGGDALDAAGRDNVRVGAQLAEIMRSLEPPERRLLLGIAGLIARSPFSEPDFPDHGLR